MLVTKASIDWMVDISMESKEHLLKTLTHMNQFSISYPYRYVSLCNIIMGGERERERERERELSLREKYKRVREGAVDR
jgi:hypothetical protein